MMMMIIIIIIIIIIIRMLTENISKLTRERVHLQATLTVHIHNDNNNTVYRTANTNIVE